MARPERTTRENLIDSTRELLWERGYAATSPRAILDRAGVGQGSMYHHFAGKEDLAAAAMAATATDLLDRAESALASGDALERLTAYLSRQRDVMRGCPVGRMAGDPDVMDSVALHQVLADTFARLRDRMRHVIAEGVAAGEFPATVVPAELADTVLAVVQGGYVLARAAGDAAPFERAVHGAVTLLRLAQRKDGS